MDKAINVQKLVEKWSNMEGRLSIKEIDDQYVKENMAILLEAQETVDMNAAFADILSEASLGSTTSVTSQTHAGLDGAFSPIALALVRRTFPELFANKIVGVQAMSGPVGLAYALRVYYKGSADQNEAAFDVVPEYSGFTGSFANSAGGQSGTADTGTGVNTSAGEAWNIGSTMPELQLKIDKTAIEAKSRKLAASFSLEAAQDIKAMHGVDIEREMVNVLQYEVQAELDRELVYKVKSVATTGTAHDVSASDGRWSQERIAQLANKIIKECNDIGSRTRRGVGNFIIVSTAVASALQALQGGIYTANTAAVNPSNVFAEIGSLNGNIKVFRDTYNTDDQIVCGFKGAGVAEAGVIYSPYIMGLFNRTLAQEDFTPRIGVMSRYAITNSLLGASRYYTKFNVSNISMLF
jgi:hypothetical protein